MNNTARKGIAAFLILVLAFFGLLGLIGIYGLHLPTHLGWTWAKLSFFSFLIALIAIFFFYLALLSAITGKNLLISKIHAATEGQVNIAGEVYNLNETLIKSPITQRQCCWYRYNISHTDQNYNDFNLYNTQSSQLLKLKDDTDECIFNIDGGANDWSPAVTYTKKYAKLSDIKNEHLQSILPQLIEKKGDISCKISESIITPNQILFLRGSFTTINKDKVASSLLIDSDNPSLPFENANLSTQDKQLQQQQVDALPKRLVHVMLSTALADKIFMIISNRCPSNTGLLQWLVAFCCLLIFIAAGCFFIYLFLHPMNILNLL